MPVAFQSTASTGNKKAENVLCKAKYNTHDRSANQGTGRTCQEPPSYLCAAKYRHRRNGAEHKTQCDHQRRKAEFAQVFQFLNTFRPKTGRKRGLKNFHKKPPLFIRQSENRISRTEEQADIRRRQTHMRQRDAGSVLQGKPFRPPDNSPFRRHLHLMKMRHTDPYSALFSLIIYTVRQNATVFTQKKRDRKSDPSSKQSV